MCLHSKLTLKKFGLKFNSVPILIFVLNEMKDCGIENRSNIRNIWEWLSWERFTVWRHLLYRLCYFSLVWKNDMSHFYQYKKQTVKIFLSVTGSIFLVPARIRTSPKSFKPIQLHSKLIPDIWFIICEWWNVIVIVDKTKNTRTDNDQYPVPLV